MPTFDPKEITDHLYVDEDKKNFYNAIDEIKAALEQGIGKKDTATVLSAVGTYKKTIEKYRNKETTEEDAEQQIPDLNYFTRIADAMYAIEAVSIIVHKGSLRRTLGAIDEGEKNLETLYEPISPLRKRKPKK